MRAWLTKLKSRCSAAAEPRNLCIRFLLTLPFAQPQETVPSWLPELPVLPALAVVRNASDIDGRLVAMMPTDYIVKAGHGSAMTLVVSGELARVATCHSPREEGELPGHRARKRRCVAATTPRQ